MSTNENLSDAFAGESQANRKYIAFAKKADQEGKPNIARLFRAAAEAETVHAHNHLKVLDGIKSTEDNVKTAISSENYEHTSMYPDFIKQARDEGQNDAARSFDWANRVEIIHENHFKKALEAVSSGKDIKDENMSVCPVCGNTFTGEAPSVCPICQTPKADFTDIA